MLPVLSTNHPLMTLGRVLLIYGAAMVAGLVAGYISSKGNLVAVGMFAGLIAGAAVVSSRKALLWFVILGGIVITGVAQLYMPGSKYIRYIVPLVALGLIFHGTMDRVLRPQAVTRERQTGIILWALAFFIIASVSRLVNWDGLGVAIVGMKGYFQMWIFLLGMILVSWKWEVIHSIPKLMFYIALLQLPFVLHQYLFLVPKRQGLGDGIVAVDVVSGTFGGSLMGGGANAVLAAFLIIVIACLLGLWKHGALSKMKTIGFSLLFLSPIFFNEAKISAIYLPLVYIILFYKDIIARPLRFIVVSSGMLALLAALLTALTLAQPSGKLHTWSDLVNFTFERQTASMHERRGQYSELSRWTALTFWAKEHTHANPVHILIGHGPGSSRVQESGLDLADTLAEEHYGGLQIGYTAVSALLWDTGILGLAAVLAMFIAAFQTAGWLSSYYRERDRFQAGIFNGLQAGIAVLCLSLAHKDFFVFNIPFQTLLLLIFGYLVICRVQIAESSS